MNNGFLINLDHYKLTDDDYIFFKNLIHKLVGISLKERKKDLIYARLRPHLHKSKIGSFSEYRQILMKISPQHIEMQNFINILTTNKTDFFREPQHFLYIKNSLIPYWEKKQEKSIRLWCCASSTGEEAYSLSLLLQNHLPKSMSYEILATDVNTQVLDLASNGVFHSSKLSEIPNEYLNTGIRKGKNKLTDWFKISNLIHQKVIFKKHNLIDSRPPEKDLYDIIFCRNVLIYFSSEIIQTLMSKLHKSLKQDGLLFIGHTESIQNSSHLYKQIQPSIFSKL